MSGWPVDPFMQCKETYRFTLRPNREIKEEEIKNLVEEGGRAIGIGTFRGVYGKFIVSAWE